MNIAKLSVDRPIFISSIVLLILFAGWKSLTSLPVSLFPDTPMPWIAVTTVYPGAGPSEIESSITQPLEDEIASLEGVKKVSSTSQESVSVIWVEFHLDVALDGAEQRLRERAAQASAKFPREAELPTLERFNPSNQPILSIFVKSKSMDHVKLTDWTERELRVALTRIPKVGKVEILGGQKPEVWISLDSKRLGLARLPLLQVAQSLKDSGSNVPAGSFTNGGNETTLNSLAQFTSLDDVRNRVVAFGSGEKSFHVSDLGTVEWGAEKERSLVFRNGSQGIIVNLYKQTGANTIQVADLARAEIEKVSQELTQSGDLSIEVIQDGSKPIRDNIFDVWESIALGILLTIFVVYLFLGSFRSTVITGFAIPNSLLGAFLLMAVFGFSVNIMTLLALSLSVGLLVDDAIVVRENIFKHREAGSSARDAAVNGANEVALAVVAVTAAILAMFGPVGFLKGVTGQFFREFGLTVCFAVLVSLFDAMAVAPMLSAYWGGHAALIHKNRINPLQWLVRRFEILQNHLENIYRRALSLAVHSPWISLGALFIASISLASVVMKTPSAFLPTDQSDTFSVQVTLNPGVALSTTAKVAKQIAATVSEVPSVDNLTIQVGNASQEINRATILVKLKGPSDRAGKSPSEIRDQVREKLNLAVKGIPENPEVYVSQNDISGSGMRPFNLLIQAKNLGQAEEVARAVYAKIQSYGKLVSPVIELKPGSKQLQIQMDSKGAGLLGINPVTAGLEVRGRLEGLKVGRFRSEGKEYDLRLKTLDPAQTWYKRDQEILVPNLNFNPVDLRKAAQFVEVVGPSRIERLNRLYSVRITADLADGAGLGEILKVVDGYVREAARGRGDIKHVYEGDSESYEEMSESMGTATLFGLVLLFLVLASLYESFLLSALNLLSLPLAISGALFAIWLKGETLNIYSLIGVLLLLGVATKNSILLVESVHEGGNLINACVKRLRPILMTSLALMAGTLPIAIGLNEASAQRTGMGIAILGGTITSTLFTLFLIPCLLTVAERGRRALSKV